MKKMTLALLLIAVFCLFAVSPVLAATTDPYTNSVGNITSKFVYGTTGNNVVSFPTSTYRPSIATTLDKTFTVPTISTIRPSVGGSYYVAKFPWEH